MFRTSPAEKPLESVSREKVCLFLSNLVYDNEVGLNGGHNFSDVSNELAACDVQIHTVRIRDFCRLMKCSAGKKGKDKRISSNG